MAEHRVPSQQADSISANTYPHPALHQLHGQNPHVAGYDRQGSAHREGVPQPMGNVVMQGEMQYPQHIDAPNYNPAHYYPPPPLYPEVPHMHMHWEVGGADAAPAQAHAFSPEPQVQVNHDGLYGHRAHFPAAGQPQDFPGVWPQPAPPAEMPEAIVLRDIVDRFPNSPDTLVNVLRIERGPRGHFEVSITLEMANIPWIN